MGDSIAYLDELHQFVIDGKQKVEIINEKMRVLNQEKTVAYKELSEAQKNFDQAIADIKKEHSISSTCWGDQEYYKNIKGVPCDE